MGGPVFFTLTGAAVVLLSAQPVDARQARSHLTVGAKVVAPCTVGSDTPINRHKPKIYISCPEPQQSAGGVSDPVVSRNPPKYEISFPESDPEQSKMVEISF
jgi:hypothetical protein